jgi:hypothetical protein
MYICIYIDMYFYTFIQICVYKNIRIHIFIIKIRLYKYIIGEINVDKFEKYWTGSTEIRGELMLKLVFHIVLTYYTSLTSETWLPLIKLLLYFRNRGMYVYVYVYMNVYEYIYIYIYIYMHIYIYVNRYTYTYIHTYTYTNMWLPLIKLLLYFVIEVCMYMYT